MYIICFTGGWDFESARSIAPQAHALRCDAAKRRTRQRCNAPFAPAVKGPHVRRSGDALQQTALRRRVAAAAGQQAVRLWCCPRRHPTGATPPAPPHQRQPPPRPGRRAHRLPPPTPQAASAAAGTPSEQVLAALRNVIDPDFGEDIVACDFVKDLVADSASGQVRWLPARRRRRRAGGPRQEPQHPWGSRLPLRAPRQREQVHLEAHGLTSAPAASSSSRCP
jgi:hypothetical protein